MTASRIEWHLCHNAGVHTCMHSTKLTHGSHVRLWCNVCFTVASHECVRTIPSGPRVCQAPFRFTRTFLYIELFRTTPCDPNAYHPERCARRRALVFLMIQGLRAAYRIELYYMSPLPRYVIAVYRVVVDSGSRGTTLGSSMCSAGTRGHRCVICSMHPLR